MTLFDIIADTGDGSQYQVVQEAFSDILAPEIIRLYEMLRQCLLNVGRPSLISGQQ